MGFSLIYFLIFLFGLLVGSFLNCLIYRFESGESFLKGRSFCPHCKHILGWQDLIPLFSFLVLKGKCRYCQRSISWQYPLVELATGILFSFTLFSISSKFSELFQLGTIAMAIISSFYLAIVSFLIIIFVYDLKHYIIPDKIIYPAILISVIWHLVSGIFFTHSLKYEIINILSSAFGAAIFFLLFVLISRGKWMGLGDVKLAFLMGLILGWPNILVALFLAIFLGAIIGLGLVVSNKKRLSSEIPFGPFLVTGTFIALFWGEKIINWYLNLI